MVDAVDPNVLVSKCESCVLDFGTVKEEELHSITIPLHMPIGG